MSKEYTREVRRILNKTGAAEATEAKVLATLRGPSPHWNKWPGNKANFRKPGTKR